MKRLIRNECLSSSMPKQLTEKELEEKIPQLLAEAIKMRGRIGGGVTLSNRHLPDYPFSYDFDSRGVIKYWKGKLPNGDPVTDWEEMTADEFLRKELRRIPLAIQEQIYQALGDYVNRPVIERTPSSRPYYIGE